MAVGGVNGDGACEDAGEAREDTRGLRDDVVLRHVAKHAALDGDFL